MNKLLITFGCSWTFGRGISYKPGMSADDLKKTVLDEKYADALSFRSLLASKHGYLNKNFSQGGSSNQRQFRLAMEYFSSLEFLYDKQQYQDIIVLWGITSIYRDEIYLNSVGSLQNIFYGNKTNFEKKYIENRFKKTHDYHNEIRHYSLLILFWNSFFQSHGIKNYWYDTFNHHEYDIPIEKQQLEWYKQSYEACKGTDWPTWQDYWSGQSDHIDINILDEINCTESFDWAKHKKYFPGFKNFLAYHQDPRDLASFLARQNGFGKLDKKLDRSNWGADTDRIKYLSNVGLVNPFSFHPTQEAHQQIADYLDSLIDFV